MVSHPQWGHINVDNVAIPEHIIRVGNAVANDLIKAGTDGALEMETPCRDTPKAHSWPHCS